MEDITRPSITRIARRSGVKSISEGCFGVVRDILNQELNRVLSTSLIVNSECHTKTLMPEHVYQALVLLGDNVAQSTELGTSTCSK